MVSGVVAIRCQILLLSICQFAIKSKSKQIIDEKTNLFRNKKLSQILILIFFAGILITFNRKMCIVLEMMF